MPQNSLRDFARARTAKLLAVALCLTVPASCITTWKEFPRPAPRAVAASSSETLYYEIDDVRGMFGGGEALREVLPKHAPFARVEPLSEPPARGVFCRVTSERRAPSVASGIAAYVSYALLFLIPFWSEEGYVVRYQAYVDGEEKKIFEYPIARQSFFWLVALPFSWVSLLTPSERDAFEATAQQFFVDAMPYFRGDQPWPVSSRSPE